MECSDKILNEHCIKFLELLSELEVKKQELENHMKNGFFHLAKARYAIGVNRVSQLSYPTTMACSVGVDFRYICALKLVPVYVVGTFIWYRRLCFWIDYVLVFRSLDHCS